VSRRLRPDSLAVHAGWEPRSRDPLAPPLYQAAVYVYTDLEDYDAVAAGRKPGHVYGRNSNENVAMLEQAVAALEGAEAGLATSSGMAAILVAALALAPRPMPIVFDPDLYGVSLTLLEQDFAGWGYELRRVDFTDLKGLAAALEGAGLAICETITNPLCKVVDLEATIGLARERGVPVLVDNTFATPVLCRPLELGAAAVVHSVTKFLGGHSDLVAGAVAGPADTILAARTRAVRMGTTLGPFEAWLALRGLRTLPLRQRRQSQNAAVLAEALASLEAVDRVHYPGLEGSPYEALVGRQLGGLGGAMVAFDLAGGRAAVQDLTGRLEMARFAASLGGVETTISYPELTSHRSLDPAQRQARGILPGTVRVSLGIEDGVDIVEDFRAAIGSR
jgi:methionine-gamma-lyase